MTDCPRCNREVPAGRFCGLCGAPLTTRPGWLPGLRIRTFGACPAEGVLRPAVASSLFPHLPQRSRLAFRVGLALILLGLVGFAALQFSAALIALAALGLPLLFALYLRASQVYRDLPRGATTLAVTAGVGLAVAWVVLTNRAAGWALFSNLFRGWSTTGDYGLPIPAHGTGLAAGGVADAVGGAVMMALAVVAVRLLLPHTREALDGFVIGVLGALAFSTAATLVRLAPQLTTGLRQHTRPSSNFAIEAGVNGLVIPLTAAAAGGVIGLALWFAPRRDHADRAGPLLWLLFGAVLVAYVGIGLVNAARLPQPVMLTLDLLLTLVCLLIVRVAIQLGLMHEDPDPISLEPLLCEHCEHVVPDAAFCAACGAATRASSKESRRLRRRNRPVPVAAGGSS